MERDSTPFLPHGGYRKLRSYKVAAAVYDATVVFCRRFYRDDRRTKDQMVQAARSGVRNISEASGAAATSRKSEMKLTNVARASLQDELLRDYESFVRQNGLRIWSKDSRKALAMRERLAQDYVERLPPAPAGTVRLTGLAVLADFVSPSGPRSGGQRHDLRGASGLLFAEAPIGKSGKNVSAGGGLHGEPVSQEGRGAGQDESLQRAERAEKERRSGKVRLVARVGRVMKVRRFRIESPGLSPLRYYLKYAEVMDFVRFHKGGFYGTLLCEDA